MGTRNLAARVGHWSATHRKTAIWGWLGFVVICLAIGLSAGTKTLEPEDSGNGEARTAARAIAHAGLNDRASEQVLVQGRAAGVTASSPAFRAAVGDVVTRVGASPYVTELKSPYGQDRSGQISTDERSALVTFEIK